MIALDSGKAVRVAALIAEGWGLGSPYNVRAVWLTPLPMRYFHGQVPV